MKTIIHYIVVQKSKLGCCLIQLISFIDAFVDKQESKKEEKSESTRGFRIENQTRSFTISPEIGRVIPSLCCVFLTRLNSLHALI